MSERSIDAGKPLVIWHPGAAEGGHGISVDTLLDPAGPTTTLALRHVERRGAFQSKEQGSAIGRRPAGPDRARCGCVV
mgnify:CR=1 FL=1